MKNYGSVENYCRELWGEITRLKALVEGIPASARPHIEGTITALETQYYNLVDSDLYRK